MSRCRCAAVDESTDEADPAPWTRPALNGLWYSGGCGRRSRSGKVDAAGSECAMVRRWMSSLGFREGRGERPMKYG